MADNVEAQIPLLPRDDLLRENRVSRVVRTDAREKFGGVVAERVNDLPTLGEEARERCGGDEGGLERGVKVSYGGRDVIVIRVDGEDAAEVGEVGELEGGGVKRGNAAVLCRCAEE